MSDAILEVENLRTWYGESLALQDVSFAVNAGEVVAILGRNGAGKTTVLRTIAGILSKRQGSIRISGRDVISEAPHRVAYHGVGFVPEERGIFPGLSVRENLMLPPQVAPGGMSLADIYALFPNLEERAQSPGMRLSGGEQQMLAIGRVLRTGAKLLLLDEPTEGLAPVIVDRIRASILLLKKRGFTCVIVEQNLAFARSVADRFYVMEDGRVVDGFTSAQLDGRLEKLTSLLSL